jgi:hypothetical protein
MLNAERCSVLPSSTVCIIYRPEVRLRSKDISFSYRRKTLKEVASGHAYYLEFLARRPLRRAT